MAGIALASTAVLVGAAPPPARPQQEAVTAATPAPAARTLSVDQLRLLAALYPMPLGDVTFDDLAAAFNGDYGPWVLEDDAYYPTEEPSAPSGLTGLGYFLSDAALLSLVDTNLPLISDAADFAYSNITSYYFEVGGAAALHVALAEATGGPDTAFGQLLQQIFNPSAVQAITSLAALGALNPVPLTDVTFDDIAAAFDGEYGPWVLEDDVYYPTEEPSAPAGLTGVGYFLSDAALLALADTNLPVISDVANFAFDNVTSYYFEVGGAAALHVALAEATGGPDTPFGQLLQRIFNPDAAGVTPGPAIGARSLGFVKAVESGSPAELPKAQPKLVNVASVEGLDKDAPVGAEVPGPENEGSKAETVDSTTDAPEPGPVKKRPKLNVTKANPLAQLRNEVKSNVNDSVKAVGKAVQKLTGKSASDEAKPTAAKPAEAEKPADKKGKDGNDA
ncbi:hypothetical protein P3H80_30275 [Mycolicibacterium septicum]|uniref:hypothetical protein n=1 Tax=Mycolicibacterium septicum TaxID=98668 RepID=UPI0023E34666|nr:hypothetical protein [Mycolicibacterium septicum]MDF3341742.1 hypothetical protein [Mycolicibacterium septicum]